jgi:hypothetical protein
MLRYLVAFFFLSIFTPALAMESVSYSVAATNNYTLIANFDLLPLRYQNLQILNPGALPLECADSPTATVPKFRIATGFTSLTFDKIKPTGILYCRYTGAGAGTITVNVWGVK